MIGIGLFAYYGGRHFAVPDSIFPTFVVDSMPAGLRGLIVAAVLAATMSAHSGALNSLAASTTHDIYLPLSGRTADDPRTLRIAKLFTMFWGVVLLAMALCIQRRILRSLSSPFRSRHSPTELCSVGSSSACCGAAPTSGTQLREWRWASSP